MNRDELEACGAEIDLCENPNILDQLIDKLMAKRAVNFVQGGSYYLVVEIEDLIERAQRKRKYLLTHRDPTTSGFTYMRAKAC